jgi:hypothetical protein
VRAVAKNNTTREASFVGGLWYPGMWFRGNPRLSRWVSGIRYTWPLARLDLEENGIRLRPRGFLARFHKPLVIRRAEVRSVREVFGGIEFETTNRATNGARFLAIGDKRRAALRALAQLRFGTDR